MDIFHVDFTSAEVWIALVTLTLLEVVLGIDNVVLHFDCSWEIAAGNEG
jgi:predicted tellurium resistance membrane protein TerC